MQVSKGRLRLSAALVAVALGAAACGGGSSGSGSSTTNNSAGKPGGKFSVYMGDPKNPLLPSNTAETEGNKIINAVFTGLVTYNVDNSKLQMDGVAKSIDSSDSTNWDVKLNDGWKFHDGTPVTADSFVKAWNFAALSTNAQDNSYFFANVVGYKDLQGDKTKAPAKTEMSGLTKVSDTEFKVKLVSPFRQYPLTLGYAAFYPLPEKFFTGGKAEQTAFGKQPIGDGPFKADGPFVKGTGITLSKFADFGGANKAKADGMQFKVYTDLNTAYTDLQGGNLDILDTVPPDAIGSFKDVFGDRAIERPSSAFQYMGFPTYDPRFKDKKVRQAFSMAIDRAAITKAIFNGTREPAFSAISPVVDGSRPDACKYCKYDPKAAKALLDSTGFDKSKPVNLWFNAGAGHDAWVQAVGNNLRDNLGLTYKLQGGLQFSEYLPKGDAKGFDGPFRLGWAMDYPSPQDYLEPLYTVAAQPPNGSNTAFYSSKEFDGLVAKGDAAGSNDEAIKDYQQAEDTLLEDMPIMPMFFGKVQGAHSDKVSNVKIDAFTQVRVADVTVK